MLITSAVIQVSFISNVIWDSLNDYLLEQKHHREAELGEDTGIFIGPPPPAMVAEAESANEAERFEEVQ